MNHASLSLSRAIPTTGSLPILPLAPVLSDAERSASAQPISIKDWAAASTRQMSSADPSSTKDAGLESTLQDIHVTSQSKLSQATGEPADDYAVIKSSSSSQESGLKAEVGTNGLVTLSSHENEEANHYDSDEDEVDSDDGDKASDNGLGLDSDAAAGFDEPIDNSGGNTEVDDEDDDENDDEDDDEVDGEEDVTKDENPEIDLSSDIAEDDEHDPNQTSIDLDRIGCSDKCRQEFLQGVGLYLKQIEALEDRIQTLSATSNDMRVELHQASQQIAELKKKRVDEKKTKPTWHEKLRKFLTGTQHHEELSYSKIYKLCCKEENMSTITDNVHPNLRLRAPLANELQADALYYLSADDAESEHVSEGRVEEQAEDNDHDVSETLFVQNDENPEDAQQLDVEQPQISPVLDNFPFEQLPANVQANIVKFVFIQENKLIHCITRLDPYMPPEEPTQTDVHSSGLLRRFHLSGKACNITYSIKPNEHLVLLAVCKRWYYLGIHAFYGLNTFAFSSLGEFGRFCTGIGAARRERIQHIELLWIGNQYLTHRPVLEGNNSQQLKWVSKRTWDVSWLCQMRRLKSLIVHIDESGSSYKRRRHEPSGYINWMTSITAGQPNFRLTRSLRTLQGLDFIHQLRGMELIRFYDYGMSREHGGRHPIRDWSFHMDIENVTSMPKAGDRAEEAKFENLTPILRDFMAPDEYLEAIKGLYRHSKAFDVEHISPLVDDEVGDSDNEMPDIMNPVRRLEAPVAQKVTRSSGFKGGKNTFCVKNSRVASAVRDDSSEVDSVSKDNDETPKTVVRNVLSGTADSDLSTAIEDGGAKGIYDDQGSFVGSNADNPIELDIFKPKIGSRLIKLQQEIRVKREPSEAVSTSSVSSQGSKRSFDSGSGLFVSSPTMSHHRSQRESTAMVETLRKRGFDDSDIRSAIDLTGDDDDTMTISTGYPSSSQLSSSRQMVSRPYQSGFSHVTSHPNELDPSTLLFARPTSDEEETPFKRQRKF